MRTTELDSALDIAARLRDTIAEEIDRARGERQLLRKLDSNGLFERAAQRASFLSDIAGLERRLASMLGEIRVRLGVDDLTLDALRTRGAGRGAALAEVLSEARALAGALQEVDRLNLDLARRALAVVRGYVETIQPAPRAYDRFGGRSSSPSLALVSSKG